MDNTVDETDYILQQLQCVIRALFDLESKLSFVILTCVIESPHNLSCTARQKLT